PLVARPRRIGSLTAAPFSHPVHARVQLAPDTRSELFLRPGYGLPFQTGRWISCCRPGSCVGCELHSGIYRVSAQAGFDCLVRLLTHPGPTMIHANPSLAQAERVDAACDRFEQEW